MDVVHDMAAVLLPQAPDAPNLVGAQVLAQELHNRLDLVRVLHLEIWQEIRILFAEFKECQTKPRHINKTLAKLNQDASNHRPTTTNKTHQTIDKVNQDTSNP